MKEYALDLVLGSCLVSNDVASSGDVSSSGWRSHLLHGVTQKKTQNVTLHDLKFNSKCDSTFDSKCDSKYDS